MAQNHCCPISPPERCRTSSPPGCATGGSHAAPWTPEGSCRGLETGARLADRGSLLAQAPRSRFAWWTVADQAVRAGRFLLADLIGFRLRSVPSRDRAGRGHYAQGRAPSRRSHVALHSLAAGRTRRPVGTATAARAKPTKTSDKPCARGRRARACRERLRPTAAESHPHSDPLEVHCDADAVRSVPRF